MLTEKKWNVVSLFAGIGGFELAFKKAGMKTTLMCEIDPVAQSVLSTKFKNIPVVDDVCQLKELPEDTDVLCAGFPCQDLSSVGAKKGLAGTRSSLVKEVFRLLRTHPVEWVVFENVSFMLKLNGGETICSIADELEKLGYNWAYRTIDSLSFVPQHRCRVFVVASLHNDPRDVVLSDEAKNPPRKVDFEKFDNPLGFYWTEGKNALGLINDGVPTLKAGSTIGIPSAPAIVFPDGEVCTPDICDAERLQGFPANWTKAAEKKYKASSRWKLVGNAITVDVVTWIAKKMKSPSQYDASNDITMKEGDLWPRAAWSVDGKRHISQASLYPATKNTKNGLKSEASSTCVEAFRQPC